MENKVRYTLGKKDKLKSRKAIEQIFKEGKSFSLFPFRVLYIIAPASTNEQKIKLQHETLFLGKLQTAFTVSKKYFKKAVDRNRIKRLMREAWRLQKNHLQQQLPSTRKNMMVFIIFTGNQLPEYNTILEKTSAVLKRLIKINNEITSANT